MLQRSTYLLLFLVFSGLHSHGAQWQPLQSQTPAASAISYISGNLNAGSLRLNLQGFYLNEVATPRGPSQVITSPGAVPQLKAGTPDLPVFTASVMIPDKGTLSWTITKAVYTDYPGVEIAPSKGNISRTVDPSTLPYRYGNVYDHHEFWPSASVSSRDPYILRDFRGQTIIVQPFTWNPATKVLRVYSELEIQYTVNPSLSGINELYRASMPSAVDPDYYSIYKNQFINAGAVQYVPLTEEGNFLIICEQTWMNEMLPFVEWKTRRGVPVEMVSIQSIGNSTMNIQSFIQNYYTTNGLTYVLLVGDAPQIATPYLSGGASDPSYGYLLGNDAYAEVMIGRFSAESPGDVQTQVERVIHYERDIDNTDTWLEEGVVIGSNQGPGDDGEMDWEHALNMRTDLLNFTYTNVYELYDGTHSGTSDAAGDPGPQDLFDIFQDGISIMTYTGHGSSTSCATTGLSNNDVQNMTNTNQLPFIWSVACVNGEFDMPGSPCFAETFLRAEFNDLPTGAVATYMSSINQSWNPPMDAQDEMVDLLADVYPGMRKRTFGGLSVNGCMHMNDNYGPAGTEMTDTWHCFGDPTLNVRTAPAQTITVNHPSVLLIGMNNALLTVSADSAMVCFVLNGAILSTGLVVNGNCNLTFPALTSLDSIYVTITGFNLKTYEAVIPVIPASGPYVTAAAGSLFDPTGNNNGAADYSELLNQDVVLTNFGSSDASNLDITITTSDAYVTLIDSAFTYPLLASAAVQTISNNFSYQVAGNVPDMHTVLFDVTITDGSSTWNSGFSQVMYAPVLNADVLTVDDSNGGDNDGILESGETADITIVSQNNGHSDANQVIAQLSSTSSQVTINGAALPPVAITAGNFVYSTFSVTLAPNMTTGTYFDLTLDLTDGAYSASRTYPMSAGLVVETFETGDFTSFNWQQGGIVPWQTSTVQPYEGLYCAVSGNIDDNEMSDLLITVNVPSTDSVGFWYRVSSEEDWDYLNFYVDNDLQDSWSGTIPWSYVSFNLTAGSHILRWSYEKDVMISTGSDCSWLDHIRLPAGTTVTGIFHSDHKANELVLYPNPANNQLNVLAGSLKGNATLQVLDVMGRILTVQDVDLSIGKNTVVNTESFSAGTYTLQLITRDGIQTKLFQVVK